MGARSVARDDLTTAARRVLEANGLGGFTLEAIAAEAGVSRVTLHRRGIAKEALLEDLGTQVLAAYREALWPALVSGAPAQARLRQALEALCAVADENLGLLQALGRAGGRLVVGEELFHEEGEEARTREPWTEPFFRILGDGRAEGAFRELDPGEAATLLFNTVGWSYIHLRTAHAWSAEHAREAIVDLVMNGVLAGPGG